jgi:hypothetical protein
MALALAADERARRGDARNCGRFARELKRLDARSGYVRPADTDHNPHVVSSNDEVQGGGTPELVRAPDFEPPRLSHRVSNYRREHRSDTAPAATSIIHGSTVGGDSCSPLS